MGAAAVVLAVWSAPSVAQRAPLASADALAAQVIAADASVPSRALAEVVDDYVREGLRSNLSLRSRSFQVEQAIAALDQARGRYFPEVNFDARYTRNDGGREIVLPLSQFNPALEDQTIPFSPETYQDTRLTAIQPLYAPAIPAAVRAQRSQLEAEEYGRLALARRLKRDITVGYLDWLRARRNVAIVDASRALLVENLRVSESLFRNGKVTQDQVLRARSELLESEQQLREAENLAQQSRSYLNFLLNRPLKTVLELAEVDVVVNQAVADLEALNSDALANRPELAAADSASRAAAANVDVARAGLKPTLGVAVDGGIQGEEYRTGAGYDFASASLQLNWRLFDGGANRAAVRGARALAQQVSTERDELAQQIQLEVQQALDRLDTARDSLATAEARSDAARAGFRIASRKRDEGVINQVEFVDARSTLTRAELNLNLTRFALLARQAELDYATAAGTLPIDPGNPGSTP
jgi:outer membrane protein TolC